MNCKDDPVFKLIQQWRKEECNPQFGRRVHPYAINTGLCEDLAEWVGKRLPDAEPVWLDALEHLADTAHEVIKYKNRYYDAEAPCGVDDIDDLPLVKHLEKHSKFHIRMHKKHGINYGERYGRRTPYPYPPSPPPRRN
jgi:hypothetical protein